MLKDGEALESTDDTSMLLDSIFAAAARHKVPGSSRRGRGPDSNASERKAHQTQRCQQRSRGLGHGRGGRERLVGHENRARRLDPELLKINPRDVNIDVAVSPDRDPGHIRSDRA